MCTYTITNCTTYGQYECTDGECVGYATDTDGGIDKYTRGTCTDKDWDEYTDYCFSNRKVKEYYPESGTCALTTLECGEGWMCIGGKCIELEEN